MFQNERMGSVVPSKATLATQGIILSYLGLDMLYKWPFYLLFDILLMNQIHINEL